MKSLRSTQHIVLIISLSSDHVCLSLHCTSDELFVWFVFIVKHMYDREKIHWEVLTVKHMYDRERIDWELLTVKHMYDREKTDWELLTVKHMDSVHHPCMIERR